MNIVKGVADLIWGTSSGQNGEPSPITKYGRFSLPTALIRFSEVGDEAILKALLERYLNTNEEGEKRKLFHIFLKQFLVLYRNWEPSNLGQSSEESLAVSPVMYVQNIGDVVVGCNFGHPAEVVLILIEEVLLMTRLLTDNQVGITTCMNITNESWMALDALTVVTSSIHNCKVFGYYSGIQKLTALMKAAVVQLKTITSALPGDQSLLNTMVQNAGVLQRILVHVVSIICNFIDLPSSIDENVQSKSSNVEPSAARSGEICISPSTAVKSAVSESILLWHQTTVVSVMEAGGLNWLLEILRLIRRLIMKEQWTDMSLQHSTLRALRSALAGNPRGQNHFRSIGGLDVLLDVVGVPSIDSLISIGSSSYEERIKNISEDIFNLHVLSLEVLREATYGNLNNLQFLCENGRVQKFANSFCSVAFMLQEYKQDKDSSGKKCLDEFGEIKSDALEIDEAQQSAPFSSDPSYLQLWKDYVARLSAGLCCFILEGKEHTFCLVQPTVSGSTIVMSAVYAELSIKWFTRVLLTVFPCIKACSDQREIPNHLRIYAYTMQRYVLFAFKKVLLSSPSLIDVFRAEGVWDFIFSESFFYFGPAPTEFSEEDCSMNVVLLVNDEGYSPGSVEDPINMDYVEILQVEVISFMSFAAILSGIPHNLPECTVLLDALEQSVCNPELASALAKSLLHVLQHSAEKTVSSFKTLAAIPRMLKVACIQVQESKRPGKRSSVAETSSSGLMSCQSHEMSCSPEVASWAKCMKILLELFAEYFSTSEDAKLSILSSSMCISCMFDLFWEEDLRNIMLNYVLDLMKTVSFSEDVQKAKVFLCSKYLETFTHLKDRVKNFADLSIELLVGMRELLLTDRVYYQALFREGECFLHVLSLLSGNLDAENGEKLVLNMIQTLICLLSQNDASKLTNFLKCDNDGLKMWELG